MSSLFEAVTTDALPLTDLVLIGIVLAFLLEELVGLPRFRRRLREAGSGGKTPLYLVAALKLWLLAFVVLAVWHLAGRDLPTLGFTLPMEGWRGLSVWAAAGLVTLFFLYQLCALLLSPGARQSYREEVEKAGEGFRFMPAEGTEHRAFLFLGLTAGITEEIIFRGYLIWAFAQVVGLPMAAVLALVIFGAFHAYQGIGGFIAAMLAGGVMTALFLLSGSLLPVIALHVLIDVINAQTSFIAKRDLGLTRGRLGQA